MTGEQIALTIFGIVLVPVTVSAFARIRKLEVQAAANQEFNDFLKHYLLREAVLTYHSNPNPDTDKIIEKIGQGEAVTAAEYQQLEDKIRHVAETAEAKAQRLKAESALDLLRWAMADQIHQSVNERAEARDRLFRE